MLRKALFLLFVCCQSVMATVLTPLDAVWSFAKGTAEASAPDSTAWRKPDFDASLWTSSRAPFYYENSPDSSTAYTGNTLLSDMNGNYSCIFMRRTFVLTNTYDVGALQVTGFSDDGFIAWVNGHEVGRFNMPDGEVPFNGAASGALPEPVPWYTNLVTGVQSWLNVGTNVFAVQAFNSSVGSSSDFTIDTSVTAFVDTAGPSVTLLYPTNEDIVSQLVTIEVGFDEPVDGIQASDLLINGVLATNITMITPSQFVFRFPQPAAGTVQVSWAPGQKIHDLSSASNAFAGGSWTYVLDLAQSQDVIISEIMANNSGKLANSVHDELGDHPDWIELYNRRSTSVNLQGWFLTDDIGNPTKWQFPPALIPAHGYLMILASGRDTNVNGRLHTGFKLSSSPSYLALLDASTNVISSFAPYPQQLTDVSYGRDRLDPTLTGYYSTATPEGPNSTLGSGFGPEVQFSRIGGAFTTDFSLALSISDTNFEIHYLVVTANVSNGSNPATNIPTAGSPLYSGPLTINAPCEVRARAFPKRPDLFPGPPRTECFIKISPAAALFTSDLPIILFHNLAGGTVPSTINQFAIAMTFEPVNGVATMTNPPTLVTRAGINIRGSSTAGLPQLNLAVEIWDEYNEDFSVPFLGLPDESDWVMFAQDSYDTSYLHNPLIHQLSRDAGRYSSRTRFAEVFLNTAGGPVTYSSPVGGNYFGLYTIEEKIKRNKNRVDIAKLEPQITKAPDLTGGYLLKIDRADPNETTFWDSAAQNNIVFQDPPGLEMVTSARLAQYSYITGYFSQFGTALWGSSYTNPVSGYAAYINVDSWIDHHILNAMTYNVDALRLSGYFFKDRNKKIEMGPLWDFDRSMGSADGRPFNPRLWYVQQGGDQGTDFFGNPNLEGVRWWQRLFTDPDFWQKWIDRWTNLRQGVFSTNHVYATIDSLSGQLKQAQPREAMRWGYNAPRAGFSSANGYSYTFPGTYQGEIVFLKKWLADRMDFIDTNFLHAPVLSASGGPIAPGTALTITASTIEPNSTIYYTLDGSDPRLPGGAISSAAFSGSSPLKLTLTNNVRLFARNRNPAHHNVTGGTIGGNPPISSPWSGPVISTFIVSTPSLMITEIMYAPTAVGTNTSSDLEFIEFKNTGAAPINLTGIHFTNGIQFVFNATNCSTNLAPGQYLVLAPNPTALRSRYPGLNNVAGPYSGSLNNGGEHITVRGALDEPILDFSYNNSWYPTTDGRGFSLVLRDESTTGDALGSPANWRASSQIGGSPGQADPVPANIPAIFVNEVLTHTDPPEHDAVELYNPGAAAAGIGGWFLTDDHTKPAKFRIPDGTAIPPGGYVTFTEKDFNSGAANSFAFSATGEEVYLFSGDGTNISGYRNGFKIGAQVKHVSFGRYVTSDGREHVVNEKRITLGSTNAGPKVGPIVINEIMYAPPPMGLNADNMDEYIELRNISSDTVALFDPLHPTNTWSVTGGMQYTFPAGTTIAPWSYVVLVHFDPAQDPVMLSWFCNRYGISTNVLILGPCEGNLDNAGDRVSLYMPDAPDTSGLAPQVLVEEVNYSSQSPWTTAANETGKSLQRIGSAAFADDPANWQASPPTAGQLNAGAWNASTAHDGLPDEWKMAYGLDPTSSDGFSGPQADPDNDGMNNLQEYIAGTSPIDGGDFLHFDRVTTTNHVCAFQFQGRTNHLYTVEKLDDLASTNSWIAAFSITPSTNGPCFFTDPLAPASRFYRIKVSQH